MKLLDEMANMQIYEEGSIKTASNLKWMQRKL